MLEAKIEDDVDKIPLTSFSSAIRPENITFPLITILGVLKTPSFFLIV